MAEGGWIEEAKTALRAAVAIARAKGPMTAMPHAGGPHHHAHEMVEALLDEVIAENPEAVNHGEASIDIAPNGAVMLTCKCGQETGRYPTASMAASALSTHVYQATRSTTT